MGEVTAVFVGCSGNVVALGNCAPDVVVRAVDLPSSIPEADVVVLGPDIADPVRTAQQVHERRAGVHVVVLCRAQEEARVAERLRLAPLVGATTRWARADRREAVRGLIQAAIQRKRSGPRRSAELRAANEALASHVAAVGHGREDYGFRERWLSTLVECSSVAIMSTTVDGEVTTWNRAAEGLFGYRSNEIIGRSVGLLVPEERRDEIGAVFADVAKGHRTEALETVRVRQDGRRIAVSSSVSPILSPEGVIIGVSATVTDISRRKEAEVELARKMRDLERSNQELEQFAYVASHDLQEPLRMVASYMELLRDRVGASMDAEAEEYYGYAVDGAKRMQALIDELLMFSRIGRGDVTPETVELKDVLGDVIRTLAGRISEQQASISIGELPAVQGSRVQLMQVFVNLIGNAIKFRGESAPRIEVSGERAGAEWRIAVTDNGIGIPEEQTEEVWGVFRRLHPRKDFPGSGIGLSVVKKIVEQHAGRVWLESEIGRGSTFYFTLPVLSARRGPL